MQITISVIFSARRLHPSTPSNTCTLPSWQARLDDAIRDDAALDDFVALREIVQCVLAFFPSEWTPQVSSMPARGRFLLLFAATTATSLWHVTVACFGGR